MFLRVSRTEMKTKQYCATGRVGGHIEQRRPLNVVGSAVYIVKDGKSRIVYAVLHVTVWHKITEVRLTCLSNR